MPSIWPIIVIRIIRGRGSTLNSLPDETIAITENPPKEHQDIYPLNFDDDREGIYAEILRVIKYLESFTQEEWI